MPKTPSKSSRSKSARKVRYAVIGLGHIAQVAMLPAFKHARNSELVALISSDAEKLRKLSKRYGVAFVGDYDHLEEILQESGAEAVYIALPNSMHREMAIQCARLGLHVLCEKPLGVTLEECQEMLAAAEENGVKLMTAYRLHFDPANLEAIEIAKSGKLGDLRAFNSFFSYVLTDDSNIRVRADLGGGAIYDLGVYCINAARYLFRSEPIEAMAMLSKSKEKRFAEVGDGLSAILRFPEDRLATFTVSFNCEANASFELYGTKGKLRLEKAYEYAEGMTRELTIDEKTRTRKFPKVDQFAPELVYFSKCILEDRDVEPSGAEGLRDVAIVQAILESAASGTVVRLDLKEKAARPGLAQKIVRPPNREPKLIHVRAASD